MKSKPKGADWKIALEMWQAARKARIDQLMALAHRLSNARLPAAEREKLPKEEAEAGDSSWLYDYDTKQDMRNKMEEGSNDGPDKSFGLSALGDEELFAYISQQTRVKAEADTKIAEAYSKLASKLGKTTLCN